MGFNNINYIYAGRPAFPHRKTGIRFKTPSAFRIGFLFVNVSIKQ